MSCSRFRTAISCRLDGEGSAGTLSRSAVDDETLDAHLARCADCRGFAADAARVHRAVRLSPAPDVPDLTPGILAAIDAERVAAYAAGDRDERAAAGDASERDQARALRWILAAIAVVQISLAIPALLFGSDAGLPVHTARHLGSFDIALAVGFLFAAWRPERIPGLLPIVAALVLCLVGSSLLDVISGTTGAGSEAQHATDFAGLAVVWLLSRTSIVRSTRSPEPGATRAVRLA
jgi:predicted anti-sigma-YlaC factor YlaD